MTRKYVLTALLIGCVCVLAVNTLQYDDLEQLGVETCPTKNSCLQVSSSSSERICKCDSLCSFYGDCCIDAVRIPHQPAVTHSCIGFLKSSTTGVYAIDNCPSTYAGVAEIASLCRSGDPVSSILSAPVTDTSTGRTYQNSYCAFCNGASSTAMAFTFPTCRVSGDTAGDTLLGLVYMKSGDQWGIQDGGLFRECELIPNADSSIAQHLTSCRTNLVSSCPENFTDTAIRQACESYMSVSVGADTTLYKNPHCALCHGVPVGDISCFTEIKVRSKRGTRLSFRPPLQISFRNSSSLAEGKCGQGQVYDPFFKKCRTPVCAIPGYKLVRGKCVKSD